MIPLSQLTHTSQMTTTSSSLPAPHNPLRLRTLRHPSGLASPLAVQIFLLFNYRRLLDSGEIAMRRQFLVTSVLVVVPSLKGKFEVVHVTVTVWSPGKTSMGVWPVSVSSTWTIPME